MATIMYGHDLSNSIVELVNHWVNTLKGKDVSPRLAKILVIGDEPSRLYFDNITRMSEKAGIQGTSYILSPATCSSDIEETIRELNQDKLINGIFLFRPMPNQVNIDGMTNSISPEKDVEGVGNRNSESFYNGNGCFMPCTPNGTIALMRYYGIEVEGKKAVIINDSKTVGKPLKYLLEKQGADVYCCNKQECGGISYQDIVEHTSEADILISAVGKNGFKITREMVKRGAVVIDVGMKNVDGKITGDVDFERVKEAARYVSPVLGGVGPVTSAMLMYNTILASMRQNGLKSHMPVLEDNLENIVAGGALNYLK